MTTRGTLRSGSSSLPQISFAASPSLPTRTIHPPHIPIPTNGKPSANASTPTNTTLKLELCLDCVTFMQDNLQALVNIITKIGVMDTCEKICGLLNDTVDVTVCEGLCDTVGIDKFWQMFVSAGINPIWACEMVNACTAGQFPAVTFTSASVTPANGPPGTTFQFKVSFTVVNETGVGETAFVVYYPSNNDHQLGFISQTVFADYTPGDYAATLTFPTNTSFVVGRYIVLFDVCSGACGQNPDPMPFATEEYFFNITEPTPTPNKK